MKNAHKATEMDGAGPHRIVATAVALCLTLLIGLSHAWAQPQTKGPALPSFDEVMQRALREKKNATNAPAAPLQTNPPPATPTSPAPKVAAPPPTPPFVLPSLGSPAKTNQSGAKAAEPLIPAPAAPNAPRKKSKEPVFSELPPDLRPGAAPTIPPTNRSTVTTPAAVTNAMTTLDDQYRLAIGDHLSFRIVEDEEDPKPLVVTDSGELELPYLGRYPAVGKTCKELAGEVKVRLEKEYYYRATVVIAVDLMTKSRGKVYLVGPVRVPGPQEIPSDEVLTLSKAILRAGGFTDFADKKNVKVTRKRSGAGGGEQTFVVNVGEILEQGRTESDLPLQPGDLIYVPERLIRF